MGRQTVNAGDRFGSWTVLHRDSVRHGAIYWLCRCDCGTVKAVSRANLRSGKSSQCRICGSESHRGMRSPEYSVWHSMMGRCHWTRNKRYSDRGIRVCKRWHTFINFYEDMGARPSPEHTIERMDNDGDYEPTNCRWATRSEQMQNTSRTRRLTHNGESLTIKEWSLRTGISYATIVRRFYKSRWSESDCVSIPTASKSHAN
jgi:hypothetical protein